MRKLRVKRNSNEKKLKRRRNIFCFFAVIYIALLLYFLFFSEHYGRNIRSESYRYNLKPFEEIGRFIKYRNAFTLEFFLVNMVGNVVAFMPFVGAPEVVYDLADRRAEDILNAIRSIEIPDGDHASCSVGVAIATTADQSFYDLLEVADRAMYASKLVGKGAKSITRM